MNVENTCKISDYLKIIIITLILGFISSIITNSIDRISSFALSHIIGNSFLILLLWGIFYRTKEGQIQSLFNSSKKQIILSSLFGMFIGICFALMIFAILPSGRELLTLNLRKLNPIYLFLFPIVGFIRPNGISLIIISLSEELLFRGVLLRSSQTILKKTILSTIIVSILFLIFHLGLYLKAKSISIELLLTILIMFIFQIFITFVTIKRKDITFAIVWHYVYDATVFGFKGFPN